MSQVYVPMAQYTMRDEWTDIQADRDHDNISHI